MGFRRHFGLDSTAINLFKDVLDPSAHAETQVFALSTSRDA